MEIFIFILIYLAILYGIYKFALSKNREPAGWVLASLIVSPIIVFVVLACVSTLPKKKRVKRRKTKREKRSRRAGVWKRDY